MTLFCGAGVAGAHAEVMEVAARLHSPIGHSLRGKEWIQFDNPYDVGMSGLLGYGACYEATHEADLLVLLGTDFPYDSFLPKARTIQVDHDPSRLGRRTPLELGIHGDVRATLRAVLPLVEQKTDGSFLDRMLRRHEKALTRVVDAYTHNIERHVPIHPEYVARTLDELAADDAVFTVDTGMCNVWAARYVTPNGRRRVIGSFLHGSMANALPHAIGAAYAYPGRQIISMSGDGGLTMLLGELLTVAEHQLPIKIVAFNNGALGMIRLEMMVSGYPSFQTDHGVADLAGLARAAGIPGAARRRPRRPGRGHAHRRAHPRPLPPRRAHRPQRAVRPAAHHRRPGPGLRAGRHPHGARRRRRQDAPARPVQRSQPSPAPPGLRNTACGGMRYARLHVHHDQLQHSMRSRRKNSRRRSPAFTPRSITYPAPT